MNPPVDVIRQVINPFRYLLDLLFPPVCAGCGEVLNEAKAIVCDQCRSTLPTTEHALYADNKVSGLFTDITKVKKSAAFCHYQKGSGFYNIIHNLKYHNLPQIGVWLGRTAAEHFLSIQPEWFSDIDFIVPIPLHKKRIRQRLYNQSELIADGISYVTGIPTDTTHLIRTIDNPTQTKRSAQQRRFNTEGIFTLLHSEDFKGKHILLVDDIVTTGATLRSAISVLTPVRGLSVSILTMGGAGN